MLRARHQVSGMAALENLDVDIRKDLVNGVTGIPSNREVWGKRVTGRDALQFSWPSLGDLGELCDLLLDCHQGNDYRARFSFIDDFIGVTDPVIRTRLIEEILGMLLGSDTSALEIAPPGANRLGAGRGLSISHRTARQSGDPLRAPPRRVSRYIAAGGPTQRSDPRAAATVLRISRGRRWE